MLNKERTVFDSKTTLRADLGKFYDQDVQTFKELEKLWIEALSESKQNPKLRKILRDEWHDQENAVLEFAEKGTMDESNMRQEDAQGLRAVGLTDEDILSLTALVSYQNYALRVAAALNVEPR